MKTLFRRLLKSPGFTAAALLTLALGIGVNTAIFSVVHAVLLRPLPYPDAERLMVVREKQPEFDNTSVALPNYLDARAAQKSFAGLALFRRDSFNLSPAGIGGEPERLRVALVSWEFFGVLGLKPRLGRDFREEDDRSGVTKTVMISERLWQARFAGDPGIIGRSVVINGVPREILGVLPSSWEFPSLCDLVLPLGVRRDDRDLLNRGNHAGFSMLGRLRVDVSPEQARAELDTIYAGLEKQYPDSNTGVRTVVRSLLENLVGDYRLSLYLLLGTVGCVLLIACANVANLLLARAAGRSRELAVRAALGASRGRIMRELLGESLVIALLGGGLGAGIAVAARDVLVALAPAGVLRFQQVGIDGAALAFTAGLALMTGLLFGLWPAWQASGAVSLTEALGEGARGTSGGPRAQRARGLLVIGQVAVALVLLAAAGLLVRSFHNAQNARLGFNPEGVQRAALLLPFARYDTPEKSARFFGQVLERVRTLPGVAAAGFATKPPQAGSNWTTSFHLTGTPEPPPGRELNADANAISPGYFATLGIPLLRGRDFTEDDRAGAPYRVIVDESFARKHFPGEDPIGKLIDDNVGFREPGQDSAGLPPMTIIGVVPTVRTYSPDQAPEFVQIYYAMAQNQGNETTLLVRAAAGDPARLVPLIRREVQALDPDQPLGETMGMTATVAQNLASRRLTMILLGAFAALALLLSIVGLYSLLALAVANRTRELGIRMALGAQQRQVFRLVVREGMLLVGAGLTVGILAAAALGRVLQSLLYDVAAFDPFTILGVAFLLILAAFLACVLPARRATRVDPVEALRAD